MNMKYAFAVLALATGALAGLEKPWGGDYKNGTHYTTITTTALTTYCPEPTKITHNGKTYTITEATTLTITDCPCTITEPVLKPSTVLYTSCPPTDTAKPVTIEKSIPVETHTYSNPLTVSYSTAYPETTATGAYTTGAYTSKPAEFIGAANANKVGGMMVGAIAGIAAFAL